ncbi:unnamed protein product [Protopolystoma xenopodis]|uniref:Uncharacterized protein n=1 Tax=Protopolystoma xenopodis TaxID=117903 RepID=A0A448WQV8_9PLAT|nr:unnamed protein product [Protopolystoma xenopodis]
MRSFWNCLAQLMGFFVRALVEQGLLELLHLLTSTGAPAPWSPLYVPLFTSPNLGDSALTKVEKDAREGAVKRPPENSPLLSINLRGRLVSQAPAQISRINFSTKSKPNDQSALEFGPGLCQLVEELTGLADYVVSVSANLPRVELWLFQDMVPQTWLPFIYRETQSTVQSDRDVSDFSLESKTLEEEPLFLPECKNHESFVLQTKELIRESLKTILFQDIVE